MPSGRCGSMFDLPEYRSNRSDVMKVGDKIKIDFAGKKKDAVVFRLFPNSVHLKVDFEKDQGKIVKRRERLLTAVNGALIPT